VGGPKDALARRVCTDSRQAREGDLFVALTGERFDGHRFLEEVAAAGAAAAVVEGGRLAGRRAPLPLVRVDDTRAALGRLGARYRQDFEIPTVAVGGSNGKSTTKELIASVLQQKHATLWSEASFNNDIGVPCTLLRLESRHRAAVFEVGSNHPGELAPLLRMVRPRFGVVTSIGPEHLEFFGDIDGVLQEEGLLAEALPGEGVFFVNASSEPARRLPARTRAEVVRVGWEPENEWSASRCQTDETGSTFHVRAPWARFDGEYRVNLLGRHQVTNALLALAVGAAFGLEPAQARRGLAECRPLKMRLDLFVAGGVRVLDDSYNANAESMRAALQTLREMPGAGRRGAVLGDMAELGGQGAFAHAEAGRRAAQADLDFLVTVGPLSRLTAEAARLAGMARVTECANAEEAARVVPGLVVAGDLLLLKASRVTGLERVAQALRALEQPGGRLPRARGRSGRAPGGVGGASAPGSRMRALC